VAFDATPPEVSLGQKTYGDEAGGEVLLERARFVAPSCF
jgi:hypothetical protein